MIDVLDYVLLGFMAVTALAAIRLLDGEVESSKIS